ncbi:purine and uridine phosphorylase [Fusarium albosuccineum]|uniref:Purine and uridine phosphorylase n=1 Tax=Fusarium albosuccineum TaxID=1237068 RepID=A0A8H4P881_9HYPO|nr:purine and uridine phosphorylase [Fusarium albosuccineum]
MKRRQLQLCDYTVGWVCALPIELAAAQEMLDDEHEDLLHDDHNDTNLYSLGRIGDHNVVIVCLPSGQVGNNCAAAIAVQMRARFTSIRFGLMVGIGGGVPSAQTDIRLGDVVVSQPEKQHGGVVQYDAGKSTPSGFQRTGALNAPPTVLLNALSKFRANRHRGRGSIEKHLSSFRHGSAFSRDNAGTDVLFESSYDHVQGENCDKCNVDQQMKRIPRKSADLVVHYGTIASGNRVMRDGAMRDKVSTELGGVLCFEMEAAGLMNSFPCLIIRGICDYADSHKNKTWQPYAAATAAACAKEILLVTPPLEVAPLRSARHATSTSTKESLRRVIGDVDIERFIEMLSVVDQEESISRARPMNDDDPEFHWIFKNVDYETWESENSTQVLWLSAPPKRNLRRASSHIVSKERSKNPKGHPSAPFFFCSASTTFQVLVHTLFHQILLCPSVDRISLIRTFLASLLDTYLEDILPRELRVEERYLQMTDAPDDTVWKLLRLSGSGLGVALSAVLTREPTAVALIVIDGIEAIQKKCFQGLRLLAENVKNSAPTAKMLLTSQIQGDIKSALEGFSSIEYDRERRECLSTLRFDNTRFGKISDEYQGSCDWLWEHPQYKEWSTSRLSSLLLIEGKPGSGKSTLTKYFNKSILKRDTAVKSAIIASFFYSYREDQDETFFYHCFQTEYRKQRGPQDWNYESLKAVLKSLGDHHLPKPLYLIIDAVDESDDTDRRNVLKLLYELCSKTGQCTIKAFVASRPIGELKLRRSPNSIRLQDETTSAISLYARSFLNNLEMTRIFDEAMHYIMKHAQGVFLWVRLVGEELLTCQERGCSEEETFEYLKSLPTELQDFYRHMLNKMKGGKREIEDAIKMFQFVLFARRPLTVQELLHALTIMDDPGKAFNPSNGYIEKHLPSERRIMFCGGNFLETRAHDGREIVQVMHQTVREYFLKPEGDVAMSDFKMCEDDSHLRISVTCIRYLMLFVTVIDMTDMTLDTASWALSHFQTFVKYLDKRPLAAYALRHLKDHINSCQQHGHIQDVTRKFIFTLKSNCSVYLFEDWIRTQLDIPIVDKDRRGAAKRFRNNCLFAATQTGLSIAEEVLLTAGVDVDARDNGQSNPMLGGDVAWW